MVDSDDDFDFVIDHPNKKERKKTSSSSSYILKQGERVSIKDGEVIEIDDSMSNDKRVKNIDDVPEIVSKYCLDDEIDPKDIKKLLNEHEKRAKKNSNVWNPMILKYPNGKFSFIPLDPNNLALVQSILSNEDFPMKDIDGLPSSKYRSCKYVSINDDDDEKSKKNTNSVSIDMTYDETFADKLSQKSIDILLPTHVLTSSSKMLSVDDVINSTLALGRENGDNTGTNRRKEESRIYRRRQR